MYTEGTRPSSCDIAAKPQEEASDTQYVCSLKVKIPEMVLLLTKG